MDRIDKVANTYRSLNLRLEITAVLLPPIFLRICTHIGPLRTFLEFHTYTIRHGVATGLKRKGGIGFIPQLFPPTKEERFLSDLDLVGKTVYDIGGFEGIFTIFFAKSVGKNGKVITFEPNPQNFSKLLENVKLNNFDNIVKLQQLALGRKKEKVTFAYHPSAPARGSVQKGITTRISGKNGEKISQVDVDSLDNQVRAENLPKPDIVKIDVEGLELDVLFGMRETIRKYRPKLIVEIHGMDEEKRVKQAEDVVKFLVENKYFLYHIESNRIINMDNSHLAKEGHIYAYNAS